MSVPIVLRILTNLRELVSSHTAMVRFSGMFAQLVVGMPMRHRQCGCTERHRQAGEERAKSANGASEHLIQN